MTDQNNVLEPPPRLAVLDRDPVQPAIVPDSKNLLNLCFQNVANLLEITSSQDVLYAGLGLDETELTVDDMRRAAERLNIDVVDVSKPANELNPLDLPAILWDAQSNAPVVFQQVVDAGTYLVYFPRQNETMPLDSGTFEARFKNNALCFQKRAAGTESETDSNASWLWSAARKYIPAYRYVIIAAAMSNMLALAVPLFIMNVYDRVLPNKAYYTLFVLAIGVLFALSFDLIFRIARARLIDDVARKLDLQLSSQIIERILNAKHHLTTKNSGKLLHSLSQYEFFREFITSNTIVVFIDIAFAFIFILVIGMISWQLALVPLFIGALLIILGLIGLRALNKAMEGSSAAGTDRQILLSEIVNNISVIKTLKSENVFLRKWANASKGHAVSIDRVKHISSTISNVASFIQSLAPIGIIVIGAMQFDSGLLTMGGLIAVVILSGRATGPLGQLSVMMARFRHALSAVKNLENTINMEDERDDKRYLTHREITDTNIEFRQVSFSYPDQSAKALDNVNLKISQGEHVGILGKIGVGKTTIGKILCRLYDPDEGDLLIGGIDARQFHPYEIRKQISFIGQDSDLFQGTLRSNLLIANPSATDEQIISAVASVGLDEFVMSHPLGFEMPVGDRGHGLSAGQKQLVNIARSILAEQQVLFLDDPTSSLDQGSEKEFVNRMRSTLDRSKTVIITTHRNAVLELVDRLIVLDRGKIIIDGPKAKVIEKLKMGSAASRKNT